LTVDLRQPVGVNELPPEDQPDTIRVGSVHEIPIIHEDDPRFEAERAAWSSATSIAQGLHSPDELLQGLRSEDWMVRHESVDRLIARGGHDERTLSTLLDAVVADPVWQVRNKIAIRLHEFPGVTTVAVLREALDDEQAEVRWSAGFSLFQLGIDPGPQWSREG
jgi:HEAT repeat protein